MINEQPELEYSHPKWLMSVLQQDWPDNYLSIMEINNSQAPMTLRVNKNKTLLKEYLKRLKQNNLLRHLEP